MSTPVGPAQRGQMNATRGTTWEADKSLDQPGRKQATATKDFDFHISYL
jgi:hypothetical protein